MWWTTVAVCLLAGRWTTLADTEIKSLHMTTEIFHRYASTTVSSRMVNSADKMGEASFVVIYPESAFITKFMIEANGKVYRAKMMNKEDVKELDKEDGSSEFTVFVRDSHQIAVSTKLEAHGEVSFLMDYEELLPRKSGVYSNIITVNPGQVVDDLNLTVTIEEPSIIKNLEVHELQDFHVAAEDGFKQNELAQIIDKSSYSKTIVWAPTPEQQRVINARGVRGQLTVKYSLDQSLEHLQQYVIDNLNFVANFFAPDTFPRLKKHIIFVLDFSFSMNDKKSVKMKKAMDRIVLDLNPNDYFSIVLIQSFVEAWSPNTLYRAGSDSITDYDREQMLRSKNLTTTLASEFLVEASPANVAKARKYLMSKGAADLGASYLIGGLRTSLNLVKMGTEKWKAKSDSPLPLILIFSNNRQTIEEADAFVDQIKALNVRQCPIYSLAFGCNANYDFLRKLSLSNYGSARVLYQGADTAAQIINFYESVSTPLFTDVTISYFPTKVKNMTRREFPLYFKGSEIVVAGKVKRDAIADLETIIGELSATSTRDSGLHNYSLSDRKIFDGNSVTKLFEYLWITQMLDKLESRLEFEERQKIEQSLLHMAIQCTFFTTYTPLVVEKPDGSKTVVEITPVKEVPPFDKVELMKIEWLHLTGGITAAQVNVTVRDKQYSLAMHPKNETFGSCQVGRMAGECRHFRCCVLKIFEHFSDFLPYKCDIKGNFLGVCCPLHVNWKW